MLESTRIKIIPLEKTHLPNLRKLRNDPETYPSLTSVAPINEFAQEHWFGKVCLDQTKMYFAILDNKNVFIGFVRCDEWDKVNASIRVGIDIIPSKRKQGYASEAYSLLLRYLFQSLHIHRVWLLVAEFNNIAINLYNKIGFEKEGIQKDALFRHGKYYSYIMMSLLENDYVTKK